MTLYLNLMFKKQNLKYYKQYVTHCYSYSDRGII